MFNVSGLPIGQNETKISPLGQMMSIFPFSPVFLHRWLIDLSRNNQINL